tara:strand:+ start:3283 stop:4443 length:1161 start_codon:yes stop_codon:yes gene_type:complete
VHKIILTIILWFTFLSSYSYDNEQSGFSVITIGPYENELYSAFGHSGIRYYNKNTGEDYFYNYGIFDFDQPNFYLNFLNGRLLYKVGKYSYPAAKNYYIDQERFVKEQLLNLDQSQEILLYNYLEQNIQPENANYLYNYVYDNCATKIRDILSEVIGDQLSFSEVTGDVSFRNLMDMYLKNNLWGDLGIDICLGPEIDRVISYKDKMFIPDFLFRSLEKASLGGSKELVKETVILNPSIIKEFRGNFLTPNIIFFIFFIFILTISFRQIKYDISYHLIDFFIFLSTGLIGLLLSYLWLFTDHLSSNNFNLVWALPSNILISFLFIKVLSKKLLVNYLILYASSLIALFLMWSFIPQNLNESLVLLISGILVRVLTNILCISRSAVQ